MRFSTPMGRRTCRGAPFRWRHVALTVSFLCAGLGACKRKSDVDGGAAQTRSSPTAARAAAPTTLVGRIRAAAKRVFPEVVKLRRDLHQHPELSGKEARTAKVVAAQLRALGLEVRTGVGGHGVVAVLKGARPGPVVAYRADMDAIPIILLDRVPWRSKVRKVGHGCGHDVHTAIAVGIARVLAALKDRLPGTVKFIFQPAEENLNGARAMIAGGVLANPKPTAIYALHTAWFDAGTIVVTPGVGLAGFQGFRIELSGNGALRPAARQVLGSLAKLSTVSPPRDERGLIRFGELLFRKQRNPLATFVFMAARYDKKRSTPRQAVILGFYRAMGPGRDKQARQGLRKALGSLKRPGIKHRLVFTGRSPAMLSDAKIARAAVAPLRAILGKHAVRTAYASVPFFGEDFAYYLQKIPGAMFWLGASNRARRMIAVPHSPGFRVDEKALLVGVEGMANVIFTHLLRGARRPGG